MAKHVANTLTKILEKDTVKMMLDKSHEDLSEVIETVKDYWLMDLFARKPSPATVDEGTDLDLLTFLYALSGRGAAINLPKYVNVRPTTLKSNEMIVSKENRHGTILGVRSNKDNFMFNVNINDVNVMGTDKDGRDVVGKPRNYILTDFNGRWYKGWKNISFMPSVEENKFITENELWSGSGLVFNNFIHPNRWISFFGQYYFETKLLIQILTERAARYRLLAKDMIKDGVQFPTVEKSETSKTYGKSKGKVTQVGPSEVIKVPAFYVEVDVPNNETEYANPKYTPENLKRISDLAHKYTYKDIPKLQVMARSVEYSHHRFPDRFPGWIKNTEWQKDFIPKGKRTKWDRIILFQPKVGDFGVAIRKRTMLKSEEVSKAYFEQKY